MDLFNSMLKWDLDEYVKDFLFNWAIQNEDFELQMKFMRLHSEMCKLGIRIIWYGFLPEHVSLQLHEDRLVSLRHAAKFSKFLLVSFHKLWVGRCSLINIHVANEVAIEEHNDLKSEVIEVAESEEVIVLA